MVCIYCGSPTHVVNSRPQRRRNQVWRRRECRACRTIFTTEETARYDDVWRVRGPKNNLAAFSRDKLLLSLYKSCAHRPNALEDAAGLTDTIIRKLAAGADNGVIPAVAIIHTVQVALNRFDRAASTHYAAFHPVSG